MRKSYVISSFINFNLLKSCQIIIKIIDKVILMSAAQGAQSQLATHEIEYERLEDVDFLNSKKLLKFDTKKHKRTRLWMQSYHI